jgi:hypothetical protein
MPARGTAGFSRSPFTAAEKQELKQRMIEVRAEGWSWKRVCSEVGISVRTYSDWRQKDEKFALMCAAAEGSRRDTLVDDCLTMARDESTPAAQRAWMLMFLTKQADPSFRDNHKVEHVVSGGLAGALKQLAKMGRE